MAKLQCKKILGDMIKVELALVFVVVVKGALLTVTGVALLVI
jgi:hypothetical protein